MDRRKSPLCLCHASFSPGTILLLFFLCRFSLGQQACDCVSADYYASENLPLASTVTSCPDWPASVYDASGRGGTATNIAPYLGELFLSQKSIPYVDGAVTSISAIIKGAQQTCESYVRVGDEALSGWDIVVLNHWYSLTSPGIGAQQLARLDRGVMATMSAMLPTVFYPLEDADAGVVSAFFEGGGVGAAPGLNIGELTLAPYPKEFSLVANPDLTYMPGDAGRGSLLSIATMDLLGDIQKTLQQNGWNGFQVGMVMVQGQWYPAIVKLFGKPGLVYAYYGRFTDGAEANKYGFTTGDEIYFSRRDLVPGSETELFQPDLRYGSILFRRDEVLQNKRFCEWHTDCRCSDMPFVPDERNLAVVDAGGNFTPIAPDNPANSNPLLFQDCPDGRTYFALYQKCVTAEMAEDNSVPDPSGRVDYSDYLVSKVGQSPVYKSQNLDGTLDGEDLSVDNMPETPAYYDNQGARLNPSTEDLMDPLDPNTVFFGYRHGPKSLLDWEGPKAKQYQISPRIKTVMADMQSFFETVISKGQEPLLNLFHISFDGTQGAMGTAAVPGGLQAEATFGSLTLDLAMIDGTALTRPLKILNPSDKYLEYGSAEVFITESQSGRPLNLHVWVDGGKDLLDDVLGAGDDNLDFQVFFVYGLYAFDAHGDPQKVGTLTVSNIFWRNNQDAGQELVGKWMQEVSMEGGQLVSSSDVYDLTSREAHTDLKSPEDRDPTTFTDKGEALSRIAYYIAVSEGLDMAMKWLYSQKDKPYIYEAAKRLENMVAVKQSAKLAYAFYKGYVEWRRLMDILAEIRDSRRSLERAFSRFKRSGSLLVTYFIHLDYASIRPTNITKIYPTRAIRYFDWSADDMQNELLHFEASLHALNLDLDRFLDGPGKRTLAYLYRETEGGLAKVGPENDKDRELVHGALQGAMSSLESGGENTSRYIRLSAITRLAIEKTKNTQVKSLEASTSGLRNVLLAIQSDSRDWLTMEDYVTHNLAGSPAAFLNAYRDDDPEAVAKQFDVHPMFRNTYVDDALSNGAGP